MTLPSASKVSGLAAAATFGLTLLGCGGPPPPVEPTVSNEEVIGRDALAHPPTTLAKAAPKPPPPVVAKPVPTTPPKPPPAPEEPNAQAIFLKGVDLIRKDVPPRNKGAASVLKIAKANGSGDFVTLFDTNEGASTKSLHTVYLHAKSGWFVISTKQFKTGTFSCDSKGSSGRDYLLAVAATTDFKGADNETLWTDNEGASCQIKIKRGEHPGDFEGLFQATFVSNDKKSRLVVHEGYFYLRGMPLVAAAGAPNTTTASGPRSIAPPPPRPANDPPRLQLPR